MRTAPRDASWIAAVGVIGIAVFGAVQLRQGIARPRVSVAGSARAVPSASSSSSAGVSIAGAVLVTAARPSGSEVALTTELAIEFSEPVRRDEVARSFHIAPLTDGSFKWKSATELRFKPNEPWRAGKKYVVTVAGVAIDGRPVVARSWQFRTHVPAPKQIVAGDGAPIVLTFDDGPRKGPLADQFLDVLKKHGVRALFFPTAKSLAGRDKLVERIKAEGHRICNHTYTHRDLTLPPITEDEIRGEIERGAGRGECRLFRPPMMAYDARVRAVAERLGYEMFLWDVDSRDWEQVTPNEVTNRVLRGARPGAVVLFHIHAPNTLRALPRIIRKLKSAGYVLSYDRADIAPGKFRVGLEQTWPYGVAPGRDRWMASATPTRAPWPFAAAAEENERASPSVSKDE